MGASVLFSSAAYAPDPLARLRVVLEEVGYEETELVRVMGARIGALHLPALNAELESRPSPNGDWDQWEIWYLQHLPYLARTQLQAPATVQRSVRVLDQDRLKGIRPFDYGRAIVFAAGVDSKGHGTPYPSLEQNGLLSLRMAYREYLFQRIEEVLLTAVAEFYPDLRVHGKHQTVVSYGVMDWGFDQFDNKSHQWIPSGSVARKFLPRVQKEQPWLLRRAAWVENALRLFGISTVMSHDAEATAFINLQFALSGEVIDFGHHQLLAEPRDPGMDWVVDGYELVEELPWGRLASVLDPLRQRVKSLSGGFSDPTLALCHFYATSLRSGYLTAQAVEKDISTLVGAVEERVKQERSTLANFSTQWSRRFCVHRLIQEPVSPRVFDPMD